MTLHATAIRQAESQAPPRMREFIASVHAEVDDMATQMEGRGERPNRESMFIYRLAQFVPTLSVDRLPDPLDRRDDALMNEIQSGPGRSVTAALKEHALAYMSANRDQQLADQAGKARFAVADVERRRAENAPVIDRLLDSGTTDEQRALLQRDLGVLEPNLLKAAAEHGVKVFVADAGTTTVPLRLYHEDVDVKDMARQWDEYHAANDAWEASHADERAAIMKQLAAGPGSLAKTASLHKQLADFDWDPSRPLRPPCQPMQVIDLNQPAVSPPLFTPYTVTPLPPMPPMPAGVAAPPEPAAAAAWTPPPVVLPPPPSNPSTRSLPALPRDWEKAALTPPTAAPSPSARMLQGVPGPGSAQVASPAPNAAAPHDWLSLLSKTSPPVMVGWSMRDVAVSHGASSEAEIDEFCELATHQNARGFDPTRPLQAGEIVIVPDHHYVEGRRVSTRQMHLMQGTETILSNDKKTLGCYDDVTRVLMVRAEALPDDNPICGHHRVALHEFGHVADALLNRDKALAEQRRATGNDIYEANKARELGVIGVASDDLRARFGDKATPEQIMSVIKAHDEMATFVSPYASTKQVEHYAESFEAYYNPQLSPRPEDPRSLEWGSRRMLEERDPAMFLFIGDDIGRIRDGRLGQPAS